ncbi:MAG: mnmH [Chitinophagaceae bacterium]|nr:mnmH [Chitinophagaceae bacterium]
MATEKINIEIFLQLSEQYPVIDVRSPGEFNHAQIPGAYSLPLFNDEERKIVGTAYKQQSRQAAIKIGLDFFGVKMKKMVEEMEAITGKWQQAISKNDSLPIANCILVHCWRGGMRSAAVAWLLDMYGFKVYTLTGGYKAFRNWVLRQFDKDYNLKILGGYTGSGKTILLQELKQKNYPVIDLENLANHKGSAFGAIGEKPQPSQEMFENLLAVELFKKSSASDIWLEDESQRIGKIIIPNSFWEKMRNSPVYFLDIPFEERLNYLVTTYGNFEKEKLGEAIERIQKRLGGLETKTAISFLSENNIRECFNILLKYYDKLYNKGLHNRKNYESLLNIIPCPCVNSSVNVNKLSLQEV